MGRLRAIVLVMLAIDLFVVGGGKEHRVSFREAATWSVIWIAITLAFSGGKEGKLYLVNRDNMGGLRGSTTADTNIVQSFYAAE